MAARADSQPTPTPPSTSTPPIPPKRPDNRLHRSQSRPLSFPIVPYPHRINSQPLSQPFSQPPAQPSVQPSLSSFPSLTHHPGLSANVEAMPPPLNPTSPPPVAISSSEMSSSATITALVSPRSTPMKRLFNPRASSARNQLQQVSDAATTSTSLPIAGISKASIGAFSYHSTSSSQLNQHQQQQQNHPHTSADALMSNILISDAADEHLLSVFDMFTADQPEDAHSAPHIGLPALKEIITILDMPEVSDEDFSGAIRQACQTPSEAPLPPGIDYAGFRNFMGLMSHRVETVAPTAEKVFRTLNPSPYENYVSDQQLQSVMGSFGYPLTNEQARAMAMEATRESLRPGAHQFTLDDMQRLWMKRQQEKAQPSSPSSSFSKGSPDLPNT